MSLRWRIAVAMGLLVALATVAVVTAAYLSTAHELAAGVDAALVARVTEISKGPGRSGPETVEDNGCPPDPLLRPASAAQIVTESGDIAVCLSGGPRLPTPTRALPDGVSVSTVQLDDSNYRVAAARFHAGGIFQLAQSLRSTNAVLGALRSRLISVAIVATLLGALAGWVLARHLVRPLVALQDLTAGFARRIVHGQPLERPGPMAAPTEVQRLNQNIGTLVDALATSREQQRRLVADAGHEIRTPLTSLTANLDLIDRSAELSPIEQTEVLSAVRADVEELTDLMTQLVDLADLAEQAVARARRRSRRTIDLLAGATGTVRGRPAMLERAIANLIDNAQKYSPPDKPIEVQVIVDTVVVVDQGPGIPQPVRKLIFERFWRADEARTLPGSGLGLAIVRQIVERHDGDLIVEDNPKGGSRIGFRLQHTSTEPGEPERP